MKSRGLNWYTDTIIYLEIALKRMTDLMVSMNKAESNNRLDLTSAAAAIRLHRISYSWVMRRSRKYMYNGLLEENKKKIWH